MDPGASKIPGDPGGGGASAQNAKNAHDAKNIQTENVINACRLGFLVSVFNQPDISANSEDERGARSKRIKRARSSAVLLGFAMTHRFTAELGETRGKHPGGVDGTRRLANRPRARIKTIDDSAFGGKNPTGNHFLVDDC
jgi:hypothetical protein